MNREEFSKKYCETVNRAIKISEKLERLEAKKSDEEFYWDDLDAWDAQEYELGKEKVNNRDIFQYGLELLDDLHYEADERLKRAFIDKVLSNIIAQEKDEYARTLKRIQKEAVLMLQERVKPELIRPMLNSYTDFKLDEPFDKTSKKSLDLLMD